MSEIDLLGSVKETSINVDNTVMIRTVAKKALFHTKIQRKEYLKKFLEKKSNICKTNRIT